MAPSVEPKPAATSGAALVAAAALLMGAFALPAAEIETLEIGLTTASRALEGRAVAGGSAGARTVALVGGLAGDDASSRTIREAVERYAARTDAARPVSLIAIPVGNPERQALEFPPTGPAYRELAEAHSLWRWLGLNAPDLVLVIGDDAAGLATALASEPVAGVAPLPARSLASAASWLDAIPADLAASPARIEIDARQARSPRELAALLAPIYAQSFNPPIYIDGMGLIAHLGLGNQARVEELTAPYIDGRQDSLAGRFGVSSLVLAGHLVFAELAERTGDARYLERARAAADFGFDANGEMLEAMPGHGEMSDAIFMGASILAAVGALTDERRYFDMAARQIDFMNGLVRRDDGLYRHSPLTDAAWGRGNGFAAIGYALTLSKLPQSHSAYPRLLEEYRTLMRTLARWQNADGSWRQVIDYPGAYHETSSTAIIGFSMLRGLERGWLESAEFTDAVDRAWRAVAARTDRDGGFIDVSESTNKQPTLEDYLRREALQGRDPRTGSFVLLFAVERMN